MKILFVIPYAPSLIRVRPFNLIRGVARRGHQVTLATTWTDPGEREYLEALEKDSVEIHAEHLPRWHSYLNCLQAMPTTSPLQAAYSWHPALAERIQELITDPQGPPFDLVHIEHLRGARYALHIHELLLENDLPIPIIWDSVDCISYLFHQTKANSVEFLRRVTATIELGRTEKLEERLTRVMNRTLVTSQTDRQAMLNLSNGNPQARDRIAVLPNGVDLNYFFPNYGDRAPATIVISGKMSYHANVAMVDFFVQDVLPSLSQRHPNVRLQIVGKNPPNHLAELNNEPGIEVTGFVRDMRPYLQQATVIVAPITYGAGIQNKVLEAMACGTPTVVSSLAVGSLKAEPGRELLVADSPDEFVNAISGLLIDETKRDQLGRAGRKYVERHHNWSDIVADLEGIYRVVNGH